MKKEICYTVPSISSRNGVTKVVANIANALCRTGKYNITVLVVGGTRDNAIALNNEIKVITIGANANENKLNYLMQIILGVRRVLSSYIPDIIVVSGAEFVLPFSLAVWSSRKSISMFQWEHRNFDAGPKFRLEWLGKRWALAFWKGTVCITKRDAMLYMSHTDKKDKINQIYNMNAFNAIRKPYNRRSKKIISCGYLAPIKGFDMLVDVAKKVDIDDLRKIAETLDMSLQKLLKAAGYDEMSFYFSKNKMKDRYYDKSSKDLKELLEQYKESETNLLTFDSEKRDKAREVGFKLFDATEKLKWIKEGKEGFTLDQVIKELTEAKKMLDPIMDKYNYSKLPGRN